mgnify:CR=1 FL=1|jgi:hypothetical protein
MATAQPASILDRVEGSDGSAFGVGASQVTLPSDLPDPNPLVRDIFGKHDDAEALEFFVGEEVVYLLPWAARHGGIAGYRQSMDTFHVRPVEFTPDEAKALLETHSLRAVALANTPAWLLDDRGVDDVRVSWHARVRWGERVKPSPDPGPAIREAFTRGVSVGIDRGRGRYYPPAGIIAAYARPSDTPIVTTVFEPTNIDDLGVDHLVECPRCGDLHDPGTSTSVCPWCHEPLD